MDFGTFLSRLFTPSGTGGLIASGQQMTTQAMNAGSDAASMMDQAIKAAQDAAKGPLDSESARQAQEAQWAKLLGMRGAAASFAGGPMAAPVVSTRQLLGA